MQAQDYATVVVAVMTIIGGFVGAVRSNDVTKREE